MTKRLIDPQRVQPNKLQSGDVMAVTVTCHITRGPDGLTYRLYCCPYDEPETPTGIPQGARIADEDIIAIQLFPVVRLAKAIPDY